MLGSNTNRLVGFIKDEKVKLGLVGVLRGLNLMKSKQVFVTISAHLTEFHSGGRISHTKFP